MFRLENSVVCVGHGPGSVGVGLKLVRILIGIAHDAGDLRGRSGNLLGDAAVKVFGRDNLRGDRGKGIRREGKSNQTSQKVSGDFHRSIGSYGSKKMILNYQFL